MKLCQRTFIPFSKSKIKIEKALQSQVEIIILIVVVVEVKHAEPDGSSNSTDSDRWNEFVFVVTFVVSIPLVTNFSFRIIWGSYGNIPAFANAGAQCAGNNA